MQYSMCSDCEIGYMQDSLRALSQISAESVSVLESLLHSDLEQLNFFYFLVMLCKVFSLTASSGSSGRLNIGSRSVPVCQLKAFSFLRG